MPPRSSSGSSATAAEGTVAVLTPALVEELSTRAGCARWSVSPERFRRALERALAKVSGAPPPDEQAIRQFLHGLHLEDLALACACEDGHDGAWEHFVREFRPQLYRAAAAIDPTGGARELADGIYGELFGLKEREGERQSLFRYFHGRSGLGTWLRAVLSQRHVDRLRAEKRTDPLPMDALERISSPAAEPAPDRLRHVRVLHATLQVVLARLAPRDRLRLACYYAQNLTLAQIGRVTGEHEATVSRHLTRTRKDIRLQVEAELRQEHRMMDAEIAECFETSVEEAGDLNLGNLLASAEARKTSSPDRSR